MKHLRIFILVLLAVLLPVRGAMAVAMLCPQGDGPGTATVVPEHGYHRAQVDHEMHADHSTAHHHAGADAADDDSSPGEHLASCHFCASGCCMASIVGSVLSLDEPSPTSLVTFPAFTALVPAFQSGGRDRSPRTI